MKSHRNYLYVRVSSVGQIDGDGIKRQIREAENAVARLAITLDGTFVDAGVSAKEGKNRAEGTQFYKMMNAVQPGDRVYIEDNDRFGRDGYKGLVDLQNIVAKKQISFYILSTGVEVNEGNFERMDVLFPNFLKAVLAKEENEKKGKRVRDAFAAQHERILRGEIIKTNREGNALKKLPGWINGQTWTLNDKAEAVKSAFNMFLQGVGPVEIAARFNKSGVKTLSDKLRLGKERRWGQSVVYRLLQDRAVIGERLTDGQWAKNYFPAALSEEIFLKAQAKFADNRGKLSTGDGERTIRNVFSGVAFCSHCGRQIKVTSGKINRYITCHGRYIGLCTAKAVRYPAMESAFVNVLKLHAQHFIVDESGNSVNSELQELHGRRAETEKQIANITEALMVSMNKALVIRQSQLEKSLEEIDRQLQLVQAKKVAVKGSGERLSEIMVRMSKLAMDQAFRAKVQGWVREHINRIDVDRIKKQFTMQLKNGNMLVIGLDGALISWKSLEQLMENARIVEKHPLVLKFG